MGLGFGCLLRKGEKKKTFVKLAVSRMCSLRADENMSKVTPKSGAGGRGGSLSPALPGAGVPPGAR